MDFEIKKLNKKKYEVWDKFVKNHKLGTIYHTTAWKKVLEETYGYKPEYYYIQNSEGDIVGIFPAFFVKHLFGKAIISLPYSPYGGPLILDSSLEAFEEIVNKWKEIADEGKMKFIEIKSIPEYKLKFLNRFSEVQKGFNFYLKIENKKFEEIWKYKFNKKFRNATRKAIKLGLKVEENDDLDILYDLYLTTMKRLGSPPHPKKLFWNIKNFLKENVRFTVCYLKDTPIASMMIFLFNKTIYISGNDSDSKYWGMNPNNLLYTETIKYGIENKYKIIDFGRTRPNSTNFNFKKKMGGDVVEMKSLVYPKQKASNVNPYRFMWASKIFKKIPKTLLKKIGPYIKENYPV